VKAVGVVEMGAYVLRRGKWATDPLRSPSLKAIHAAVRALDGTTRTVVVLAAAQAGVTMEVSYGGPDLAVVTLQLEPGRGVILASQNPGLVPVSTRWGANETVWQPRYGVGIREALQAVDYFFTHGAGDPALVWEPVNAESFWQGPTDQRDGGPGADIETAG
jgi:hypothetical protein